MYLFIHLLFFPIHKIIIINIFSTYIKKKIICLFLAAPGLCCCKGLFCSEQGLRSAAALGLLPGMLSLAVERALGCAGFSSCNMQAQELWCMGLAAPQHGGSRWTRDQTHVPCIGRWTVNHWTSSEAPCNTF